MNNENSNRSNELNSGAETMGEGPISSSNGEQINVNHGKHKRIIVIVIATIISILLIISIVILISHLSEEEKIKINYACMIDAGSSSSKEHIYKLESPSKEHYPVPELFLIADNVVKPALGKLIEETDIKNHLNSLFDFCESGIKNITNNKVNTESIPFYLLATAGLRTLDIEVQKKIINIVRDSIKERKFLFKNDYWAKVLTGAEEGIFGWIAINYLTKAIIENNKEKKIKNNSHGVLDLGGSSLEITFLTNITKATDNIYSFEIGDLNYPLYTYSFEHYGQNDMYSTILQNSITDELKDNPIIQHPCLFKGYNETATFNDTEYIFNGTGNFEQCHEMTKKVIKKKECNYDHCSFEGVYQPIIEENQKFYAISGFAYIAEFFGFKPDIYYSAKEILNETEKLCNKTVEEIKKEYGENLEYSKMYCYAGNYIYNLLVNGFGFDENWKNIIFSNKVNGKESGGWSQGAMVYEGIYLDSP